MSLVIAGTGRSSRGDGRPGGETVRADDQAPADPPTGPLSWDEAREAAHTSVAPTAPEQVPLAAALGGVLAEPLRALAPVPSMDCSAMDGYAVRGAPPWTIVASTRAGDAPPPPLLAGTACEIATGAPVPHATDGVLPYEQARRVGRSVTGPVVAGGHIRRAGEQCAAGELVLAEGHVIGPATLGLAAALGHDTLRLRRAPRVQALITGDELLFAGIPTGGRVRDAIGPMLPGLVAAAGARFDGEARLPDSAAELSRALRHADADIVVVSGSSSRGPADHLRAVLVELRAHWVVNGVRCRPGHPQAMARLPDGRLVVGLPGNPLAAFVAFLTLALPAVTGLRGEPLPELAELPADPAWTTRPDITRLVPVRKRGTRFTGLPHSGSAMLRGLAAADALAVIAPDRRPRLHPLPRG